MKIKLAKSFTHQQDFKKITDEEIAGKEVTYDYPYLFCEAGCPERIKTKQGMLIHVNSCAYIYANTSKYFEVKQILTIYGKAERRLPISSRLGKPPSQRKLADATLTVK